MQNLAQDPVGTSTNRYPHLNIVTILAIVIANFDSACADDSPPPFYARTDASSVAEGGADATEDGETPDASITATFDPARTYLDGTFSEGLCGRDALEDFDPSSLPHVGLPCSTGNLIVRPTDGQLLYLQSDVDLVRVFAPDPWSHSGTDIDYPRFVAMNDPVIETTECTNGLRRFWVVPDTGEVVYECHYCGANGPCARFLASGGEYALPPAVDDLWPGVGGHVLVDRVGDSHGVFDGTTVTPIDFDAVGFRDNHQIYRARSDGFRAVDYETNRYRLFHIGYDGVMTFIGAYPRAIDQFNVINGCKLDASDAITCIASAIPDSADVVVRASPGDDAFEIIHDERNAPLVKLHISWIFTGP